MVSIGSTRVHDSNGISIGSAVFAGLTSRQTDRQTDHGTPSVSIGRIYVRCAAMRPNNTNKHVYGAVNHVQRPLREFTWFVR